MLYLRLSPTMITSAMPSQCFLTASSMGTGAMFSPPSPMMSSLYRPVILIMPCAVIMPLSPECNQPSSSIVSAVFFRISCKCAGPKSGQAMYPIMMFRPRKQSSPWYFSSPWSTSGAFMHSTFLFKSCGSTKNALTSTPGISQPHEPHTWAWSVENVQAPVHSDMPYTSLMNMFSDPKYSIVSTRIGAAPVKANLHWSRPSLALTFPSTSLATVWPTAASPLPPNWEFLA
mmetsp:Transcript_52880/g.160710  ORF Transcript_52880/g.160710 Transcript_52880/m.160710 type:complete len:230 (-) Transcript_52880:597-1286(-)